MKLFVASIMILVLVYYSGDAWAQIPSSNFGFQGFGLPATDFTVVPGHPIDATGVNFPNPVPINTQGNPIVVVHDPSEGAVRKSIDYSNNPINPNDDIRFEEFIEVGPGGLNWNAWNMNTFSTDWSWSPLTVFTLDCFDCGGRGGPGTFFSNDGFITFDMNDSPLIAGDKFRVLGTASYSGQTTFTGILEFDQWPSGAEPAQPVGGEIIPLDSTMILLAGTQSVAAWMIPAIVSVIGIGIVILRKH